MADNSEEWSMGPSPWRFPVSFAKVSQDVTGNVILSETERRTIWTPLEYAAMVASCRHPYRVRVRTSGGVFEPCPECWTSLVVAPVA